MKKIFMLIFIFCFPMIVSAETCNTPDESTVVTYYAGDYSTEPYCVKVRDGCSSGSKTLCSSGCFPLTIASILKSYGKNVTPTDISRYLCSDTSGFKGAANSVTYGNIVTNSKFLDQFDMEIVDIPDTIAAIDEALSNNKMVLASVNNRGIFTPGLHYIGIAMRRENGDYYVINTSTRDDPVKKSGWYTREQILVNVIKAMNNGLWSVQPKNCSSYIGGGSSSGGNSSNGGTQGGVGSVEDPFPDIFPGKLETEDGCGAIFVDQDGNLNELGEFVNDLFAIIKIAAPVLVIILSTVDYVNAIATASADDLKKANKRTIKRAIAGLVIFFLPFLLDIVFELFGLYDISKCQIVK